MNLLKKLFSGGPKEPPAPASVDYQGYKITPAPEKTGAEYRIGAMIEKDGKTHHLIRADTLRDADAASDASIAKAQQMIDHLGDRLFN
ncbi:hypothetical protein JANAI62_05530 [Jannaschia pagri]|uniref:Transcriptional activator HlyU n=1 Tax=Jannaschia pagri TaxID=2829797 RepID=A0ABQ4NIA7_9RHOB|nr:MULTISPECIES: HlyU family transcriptional regulator [unclassified Jannaschia]GIT89963.1 hypothetical protein JANAI61_04210 [Jannaschia sp. AI_61]GIT93930.1 hypothetical protein JANAI62_05530 [Jannaschia sp. AI_62]